MGIDGDIDAAARIVRVQGVPLYTDSTETAVTNLTNLAPVITQNGVGITPASGAAQDFSGLIQSYTVTAADGSTAAWTVIVNLEPLTSTAGIGTYIGIADDTYAGTAAKPIPLPVGIELTSTNWGDLLAAINTAGKSVALDLSACTKSGISITVTGGLDSSGVFNPGKTDTDSNRIAAKGKIVSLVLPEAAESIQQYSPPSNYTFKNFTALTSVTGAAVKTIGTSAFSYTATLTSVNFPAAETVGSAFDNCTSLTSVNFPAATRIFSGAFNNCTALTSVSLPASLTTLDSNAFSNCTALTSVSLPASLITIGDNPFRNCPALTNITVASGNPNWQFKDGMLISNDGTILVGYYGDGTSITLPSVETVGAYAFYGHTALASVSLPAATHIGNDAFAATGTGNLALTLGTPAPTLGSYMFSGLTSNKNVTVYVPAGAAGYTNDWKEGFKLRGWDGSFYLASQGPTYITLTITELP
jgi:hypothetical protein